MVKEVGSAQLSCAPDFSRWKFPMSMGIYLDETLDLKGKLLVNNTSVYVGQENITRRKQSKQDDHEESRISANN